MANLLKDYFARELEKQDANSIHDLAMLAWKYTYKEIYSEDFIENYVNRSYRIEAVERIVDQTSSGLTGFYVLVERKSTEICGFAQVGYNEYWQTGQKNLPLRLFRIYLCPEKIGKGLGGLLLEKIEGFVRQEKQDMYIVGVHEKNMIGRHFYEKNGFILINKKSDAEGEIYYRKKISL